MPDDVPEPPSCRTHFLCERCGGTGHQEAGKWDGAAYAAPAGVCDLCLGSGWLGPVPERMRWRPPA